ncbi:MAG: hypothetical protein BM563_08540 [Bacteroidetes bacterium MedPE-SWsnd-G1]|uniref:Uncharacterized protein n=1 Tax=Urechidicola vernalis TaxID=3075600 RepID=A0ABU2Y7D1_9FLAO|nr:hypothetical protein [Urechidicola sp. P050]MDT0553607.1 hypothetical protein [Urechidicola sp. P050]OIQ37445.1 MAG: hypothetical protein BM563_08540 [Bacteroidetes bacterium MedPE-SWsnd-G1]
MTIISFFIPTDKDILRDIKEDTRTIKFIGEGSVKQKLDVTKFIRKFIYRFDAVKTVRQIVYIKKGLSWELESISAIQSQNKKIS